MAWERTGAIISKPLLYIEQPSLQAVINEQIIAVKATDPSEEKRNAEPNKSSSEHSDAQEPTKHTAAETTVRDNVIKNGVNYRAFALKSIEEKIEFLTTVPHNMPPVVCEFKTIDHVYRGVLLFAEDHFIAIRHHPGKETVSLKKEDIREISTV